MTTITAGPVMNGEAGDVGYVVLRDEAGDWVGECRAELAPLFVNAEALWDALADLRAAAAYAYQTGRINAEPFVRAGNVLADANRKAEPAK